MRRAESSVALHQRDSALRTLRCSRSLLGLVQISILNFADALRDLALVMSGSEHSGIFAHARVFSGPPREIA